MQPHEHHDLVVLPNGLAVRLASYPSRWPREVATPDYGVYLDERWQPRWPHVHIVWPDFGVPVDIVAATETLVDVLARAQRGDVVELGCLGGHGRTGSALGMLAVLSGSNEDPVDWVRRTYCEEAIETEEQATMVREFADQQPR